MNLVTTSTPVRNLSFVLTGALLGAGFAMASGVSADTGTRMGFGAQRGTCNTELHDEIEQAIEDGEYETWKELMDGRGRITEVVTAENFDTFAEMHEAMEDGDYAKAAELRKDLGLGLHPRDGTSYRGNGLHKGWGRGHGMGTVFNR